MSKFYGVQCLQLSVMHCQLNAIARVVLQLEIGKLLNLCRSLHSRVQLGIAI